MCGLRHTSSKELSVKEKKKGKERGMEAVREEEKKDEGEGGNICCMMERKAGGGENYGEGVWG